MNATVHCLARHATLLTKLQLGAGNTNTPQHGKIQKSGVKTLDVKATMQIKSSLIHCIRFSPQALKRRSHSHHLRQCQYGLNSPNNCKNHHHRLHPGPEDIFRWYSLLLFCLTITSLQRNAHIFRNSSAPRRWILRNKLDVNIETRLMASAIHLLQLFTD